MHCTDLSKTACKHHCLRLALGGWRWIQCCQEGKAKCGPGVLGALPWLWGHRFTLPAAGVSQELRYLAPFHNLILLPSYTYLQDFRPSLCFAPWANIDTSSVDMESSSFQQDAQRVYFVQISLQGAGEWNPRLTNSQTQATPPAKCIFPRLKHFCLSSLQLLTSLFLQSNLCPSSSLTYRFPPPTKNRGLKLPKTIKPNHK